MLNSFTRTWIDRLASKDEFPLGQKSVTSLSYVEASNALLLTLAGDHAIYIYKKESTAGWQCAAHLGDPSKRGCADGPADKLRFWFPTSDLSMTLMDSRPLIPGPKGKVYIHSGGALMLLAEDFSSARTISSMRCLADMIWCHGLEMNVESVECVECWDWRWMLGFYVFLDSLSLGISKNDVSSATSNDVSSATSHSLTQEKSYGWWTTMRELLSTRYHSMFLVWDLMATCPFVAEFTTLKLGFCEKSWVNWGLCWYQMLNSE